MSGWNKIQLVCQPHNDYLKDSLIKISNALLEASKYTISDTKEMCGWNIHQIKYNKDYWHFEAQF